MENHNEILTNPPDSPTRDRIFKASARLFAQKGFHGVSMREISQATGLSKPTIYYYFGSKEGIYKSLIETGISHTNTGFDMIYNQNSAVKQKLIGIAKAAFREVQDYPEYVKFFLLLFISAEKLPFLESLMLSAVRRRTRLEDLIRQGVHSGEFGINADPHLAAEIFTGAISHYIWKQLNCADQLVSDQLAENVVEFLFKGLNE
jgi:AcrR family transcriptional regulator